MFKKYLSKKLSCLILIGILVLGITVRLKDFNILPIDAHPMRQTDTECVAYSMAIGKSTFLKPKNCLIRPVSNTEGYFFLEMPFYELLIAASYKVFGIYPFAARLVNLFLYLIGSLALFGFMSKWWNKNTALFSVMAFSFIPGSIFFVGHAIHPDAMAVSFILVSMFFGWEYREKSKIINLLMSGLFLGISVASRPFGLICLPVLGYFLYLRKSKFRDYVIILFLSLFLYGCWRWWISYLKIDISWENWVMNGREKLFHFVTLKNLIWKNVIGETMGKVVSVLAGFGLLVCCLKKDKRIIPLILWIVGVMVYWLIVPDGNITHQYYADIYIPLVAILAGIGLNFIFSKMKFISLLLVVGLVYNGIRTSNYHFNDRGKLNDVVIAKEIENFIPNDKKIIYLAKDNSIPLSLSHRQGWMLGDWPIDVAVYAWAFDEMKKNNFDYIVESKNGRDIDLDQWNIIKPHLVLFKESENIRIYTYK